MVHLIKGILTNEECNNLIKQFDIEKKINPSYDKIKDTGNTYGFEPSYTFNSYLEKLKSKILEINSNIDDLTNVNTYVREYKNNDYLKKHVDRSDISVTMSVCLETTINKNWPLCVEINDQEHSYNINTGDGLLLFHADKITHWRDMLICNENERVVQFFLHWAPVKYETKKSKTII
jgi:hypothetical protein